MHVRSSLGFMFSKTLKCEITLLLKESNHVTHTQVKYLYFFLYSDISFVLWNFKI
jgi:hypothetical protein